MGRPVNLGKRLYNGVCPPSNPGRVGRPERDFCPRIPNPQVAPCPAAIPRPFRVRFLRAPGAGRKLSNVNSNDSTSLIFDSSASRRFQSYNFIVNNEEPPELEVFGMDATNELDPGVKEEKASVYIVYCVYE